MELAEKAEQMANFCQHIQASLKVIDITIDSEVGRFLMAHKGDTPEVLEQNYHSWENNILQSLPKFDQVIQKCRQQAGLWRDEYRRQEASEALLRQNAAEAEAGPAPA